MIFKQFFSSVASPVCLSGKSTKQIKMSRSLWRNGEMILTEQNRNAGRETGLNATLATTNLSRTSPGSNKRLRGERSATNRLSQGMSLMTLLGRFPGFASLSFC